MVTRDIRRLARPQAILVLLITMTFASGCMRGGSGVVLDSATEMPIAGATLTLECERWALHGSRFIRDVVRTSDSSGRYSFSSLAVADCSYGYIRPAKPGYTLSSFAHIGYYRSGSEIPQRIYLTKNEDLVMLRLRAITPARVGTSFTLDGRPSAASEFQRWYAAFFEAKRIARTPHEIRFVREHYCRTLAELAALLSPADLEKFANLNVIVTVGWNGVYASGPVADYHNELRNYCTATAPN